MQIVKTFKVHYLRHRMIERRVRGLRLPLHYDGAGYESANNVTTGPCETCDEI